MGKTHYSFTGQIMKWQEKHQRVLPWNNIVDPYRIWVSEIILQQTRVAQGLDYYYRFIDRFPNVKILASARQEEVLKVWEGLGYYSRAVNIHKTAGIIMEKYNGNLPDNYKALIHLPGIGPYTASAILSFAFHQPVPAIDGNALRVYSRYFGIEKDVSKGATVKEIVNLSSKLIPEHQPGRFNHAVFNLGSKICTPKNPKCHQCPLQNECTARLNHKVDRIPWKKPKAARKLQHLTYCIIRQNHKTCVRQRNEKGIWQGLYEFPERQKIASWIESVENNLILLYQTIGYKYILTHLDLIISFHVYELVSGNMPKGYLLIDWKDLAAYPLPVPLRKHVLENNTLLLN
ncbi:MAG TPA: A/G-specific adenine glycosylase [Saprospiraceae bacterium]|nr:A/G-specific adenine glycosylase [Saprospiraceae bacterium]